MDGAVILLGNDGPPTDRVDRDGGVDNYVNRTGMAEVNAGMLAPPYHVSHCYSFYLFLSCSFSWTLQQIAGIDCDFPKFHSDIV